MRLEPDEGKIYLTAEESAVLSGRATATAEMLEPLHPSPRSFPTFREKVEYYTEGMRWETQRPVSVVADEAWSICAECTEFKREVELTGGLCRWCTPEGKAEAERFRARGEAKGGEGDV